MHKHVCVLIGAIILVVHITEISHVKYLIMSRALNSFSAIKGLEKYFDTAHKGRHPSVRKLTVNLNKVSANLTD